MNKSETAAQEIEKMYDCFKTSIIKEGNNFVLTLWSRSTKESGVFERLLGNYAFSKRGNQFLFTSRKLISLATYLKNSSDQSKV